jgi:hypothetical protein
MRHEAKSLLFLGVSLGQIGDGEAARRLEEARRIARGLGARPIADVAKEMLAAVPR